MSLFELLKPLESNTGMITRSDVDVSSRLTNYGCSMIPSYLNTSQDFPVDRPEYPYHEDYNMYPPSFFELSDSCNSGKQLFESMINDFITKNESQAKSVQKESLFTDPLELLENYPMINNDMRNEHDQMSLKDSPSFVELLKDARDIRGTKEEEPLTYSSPVTPIEPFIDSNDSSNPLAQLEHISFEQLTNESLEDRSATLKHSFSSQNVYDTSSVMYGNDDMTMFSSLVNCNEVMRNHKSSQPTEACQKMLSPLQPINEMFEPISPAEPLQEEESPKTPEEEQRDEGSIIAEKETSSLVGTSKSPSDESKKSKLTGLQRRTLDSIFSVTDRPSRGLVLHIAAELCLHHITVKNFFSNGRRRLRRAAARVSDPERTRRENQRRKEKRRLAAIAASTTSTGGEKGSPLKRSPGETCSDSQSPREPPVLSPERKALMEKLAVKVQRSVAQKGLQALMNYDSKNKTPSTPLTPHDSNTQSIPCLESIFNSQIHSNVVSSPAEPAQAISIQQPVTDKAFQQGSAATSAFENFFLFGENSDQFTNYHQSPDQNIVTNCLPPQDQTQTTFPAEEGPYSPTSWQALWNA